MGYNFDLGAILTPEYLEKFVSGLFVTLQLGVIGWIVAFVLAVFVALIRIAPFRPGQWLAAFYIEYHRSVPMLVQLLVWYFAMPEILPDDLRRYINAQGGEFIFAVVAIGLGMSSYMAEDLRSGFRSVPKSQFEAAKALGFSYMGSLYWIVVPQVLRVSIPPLVGQTLFVFKTTALASAIGVAELTHATKTVENQTFRVFEAFLVGTSIYIVLSLAIMMIGNNIADRFRIRSAR